MMNGRSLKDIYILVSIVLISLLVFQGYLLNRQYQLLKAKVYEIVLNNFNELNNLYNSAKQNTFLFKSDIEGKGNINKTKSSPIGTVKISKITEQKEDLITVDTVLVIPVDQVTTLANLNILADEIKSIDINKNSIITSKCDTCLNDSETAVPTLTITIKKQTYPERMKLLYQRLDTILPKLYANYSNIFSFEFGVSHISGDSSIYYNGSFEQPQKPVFFEKNIGSSEPILFHLYAEMKPSYWLKHILFGIFLSLILIVLIFYLFNRLLKIINSQKRLDAMKTDFINNMTHEFKTPIATVSLALESIQHFGVRDQPEKMDEYLDIAQGELKKVNGMIEKVLNISKDTEFKLKFSSTHIPTLIRDSVQQMKTIAESQQATISIETLNEIPPTQVDVFHLNNVFINLIDNSLKYKREDPEILIQISSTPQEVLIQYTDNGKGISEQYLPHIFDNFFRVPAGNIHDVKGFGVGLSYVSKIIQEHEGKISVQSKLGSFTTFIIQLPIL